MKFQHNLSIWCNLNGKQANDVHKIAIFIQNTLYYYDDYWHEMDKYIWKYLLMSARHLCVKNAIYFTKACVR